MSDEKTPLDQALDVFVFAPLGLVLNLRDVVPELAQRGRNQVQAARMLGQMAIQMGQQEAGKKVGQARRQAEDTLAGFGIGGAPSGSAAAPASARQPHASPAAAGDPSQTSAPASAASVTAPADPSITVASRDEARSTAPTTPPPAVGSLAIHGYDTLSASQVVQRLAGLSGEELEAVRAYEAAGRSRKTILNRIAQLQGESA